MADETTHLDPENVAKVLSEVSRIASEECASCGRQLTWNELVEQRALIEKVTEATK
jgi:hypothetical protein